MFSFRWRAVTVTKKSSNARNGISPVKFFLMLHQALPQGLGRSRCLLETAACGEQEEAARRVALGRLTSQELSEKNDQEKAIVKGIGLRYKKICASGPIDLIEESSSLSTPIYYPPNSCESMVCQLTSVAITNRSWVIAAKRVGFSRFGQSSGPPNTTWREPV
jgi:hypothetical protein